MKKLSTKIMLLSVSMTLIIVVILSLSTVRALRNLSNTNYSEYIRTEEKSLDTGLKNEVDLAKSVIKHIHNDALSGIVSEDQAKENALNILNSMRYGGSGSFFVVTSTGDCLLYPLDKSLVGQNIKNMTTEDGQLIISDLINVAISNKTTGGFVDAPAVFSISGESTTTPARVYAYYYELFDWVIFTYSHTDYFEINGETYLLKSNQFISEIILIIGIFVGVFLVLSVIFSRIMGNRLTKAIVSITEAAHKMAEGDLTFDVIQTNTKDETRQLASSFNKSINHIRDMVHQSKLLSENVHTSSSSVSDSMKELTDGTNQIASSIHEISIGVNRQAEAADKIHQMSITMMEGMNDISAEMQHSSSISLETKEAVADGQKNLAFQKEKMFANKKASETTASSISNLTEISSEISSIISVIEGISSQTTLLALNASIEAARAGEHGRGFAVVADEIRKLADGTVSSTKKISEIIKDVNRAMTEAEDTIKESREAVSQQERSLEETSIVFNKIVEAVDQSYKSSSQVKSSTAEMVDSFKEINGEISEIASIAQQSAASVEEVSATTHEQTASFEEIVDHTAELERLALSLNTQMSQFKVNEADVTVKTENDEDQLVVEQEDMIESLADDLVSDDLVSDDLGIEETEQVLEEVFEEATEEDTPENLLKNEDKE